MTQTVAPGTTTYTNPGYTTAPVPGGAPTSATKTTTTTTFLDGGAPAAGAPAATTVV